MAERDLNLEYRWYEMAAADDTVDSPFWPMFGELTLLLKQETSLADLAQRQNREIEVRRVPMKDSKWVRLELFHPTGDVASIIVQANSRATEGVSCALIIELGNLLKSMSNSFATTKSELKVCSEGPRISGLPWADLVIASSNYVRHKDEWAEAVAQRKEPNKFQKMSTKPLMDAGLSVWDANQPTYFDVAKHLQINEWKTLFSKISDWLNACLPSHPGKKVK